MRRKAAPRFAGFNRRPDEIARAVRFLVVEETRFATGATPSVNGGQDMA